MSEKLHAALALILSEEEPKRVLLAKRHQPENPHKHDKWHLPGGAVEDNETPTDAIYRELDEELGWTDLKIVRQQTVEKPNDDFSNRSTTFDIFLIQMSMNTSIDITDDPDASDAQWFTQEELKNIPIFSMVLTALNAFKL